MKRLEAIGNLVPDGSVLVDVGTDHAYLIVDLILKGKIPYAYGIDINEKPLSYARKHIEEFGVENKVELILGDGLKDFHEKADTFVLAGLGGETILDIIATYNFQHHQRIIMQPNTKWPLVRQIMNDRGFSIVDEVFVVERDIPSVILAYEKGFEKLSQKDIYLGPILQKQKNEAYQKYLTYRQSQLEDIYMFKQELTDEYTVIKEYLEKGGI